MNHRVWGEIQVNYLEEFNIYLIWSKATTTTTPRPTVKIPHICYKLKCLPVLMKIATWKGICPHINYVNNVQPWNYQFQEAPSNFIPPYQLQASRRPGKLISTSELFFNHLQSTVKMLHEATSESQFQAIKSSPESTSEMFQYKLQIVSESPSNENHPTIATKASKVSSKIDFMRAIKVRWLNLLTKKMKKFLFIWIQFRVDDVKILFC